MTSKTKSQIKSFFETGDKPTESQFIDLIDSYVDKSGPIGTLETAASANGDGFVRFASGTPSIITTAAMTSSLLYATTAQANTGTVNGLIMDPVLVKNAISSLASTTAGWSLLATATAATSSTLDFTSSIDSTYDHYIFDLVGLTLGTATSRILMQGSTDGGSSWLSTNSSNFIANGIKSDSTTINTDVGEATTDTRLMQATNVLKSTSTLASINGMVHLYNPGSAVLAKLIMFETSHFNGTSVYTSWGSGSINTATAINGIRFKPSGSSATVIDGTIKMYGVRKT